MIQLVPQMPDAHFLLGEALLELGQYPESENELQTAIRLGNTSPNKHTLGYLMMLQGKDNDAISRYLKALEIGPETALLCLNLGISYERLGLPAQANAYLSAGPRRRRKRPEGSAKWSRTGRSCLFGRQIGR